jgi:hypothetical protein
MNTPHLYDFLWIIDRAHGIARIIDSINELLAFNGYYNIDEFKKFVKKKSKKAYLEHIPISLGNVEGFSIYMNCLNALINERLKLFTTKCGLLVHQNLVISDTENNPRSYNELSTKAKEAISAYLFVQREALIDFQKKINQKEVTTYLSSVTEYKEPVAEPYKNNQQQPSASAQNNPGEIWIAGVLYYNNEKVCMILDATKRTMQRYRIKGILPFKNVNNKYFYRALDVDTLFDEEYK